MNGKKLSVYLESSFVSYLIGDLSNDFSVFQMQKMTRTWWNTERYEFDLAISTIVVEEISRGNQGLATGRIEAVKNIPVLRPTPDVLNLYQQLVASRIVPSKAYNDALHLAMAIGHEIDFLLTWNCKHIANAFVIKNIMSFAEQFKYKLPVICTPQTLIERVNDE